MQLSRRQLYELVSNAPLSKVAPELGISPSMLSALCQKYNVPYPGSGYWTKKLLGIEQAIDPLPPASDADEGVITIEPAKPRRKPNSVSPPNSIANASTAAMSQQKARSVKQHPLVVEWMAAYERRRREALASGSQWRIDSSPPLTEAGHRRYDILSSLFRALEARGAKVSEGEKGLARVTIDGEKIDFQVREKNRQVRIPPSDKRNYSSQELIGTGKLVFAIRTYLRGPHNEEWRETNDNPLENQVPKFVERLFEGAAILKAWHIELEQDRLHRQEEAERRAERARLAEEEKLRRNKLHELAQDWHHANEVRAFIAAVKTQPFDPEANVEGKTIAEWLIWAEAATDMLDKSRDGAACIFSIVGQQRAEDPCSGRYN